MGRRTLLLIASIDVAAVGTGPVPSRAGTADGRVQAGGRPGNSCVAKRVIPPPTACDPFRGQG